MGAHIRVGFRVNNSRDPSVPTNISSSSLSTFVRTSHLPSSSTTRPGGLARRTGETPGPGAQVGVARRKARDGPRRRVRVVHATSPQEEVHPRLPSPTTVLLIPGPPCRDWDVEGSVCHSCGVPWDLHGPTSSATTSSVLTSSGVTSYRGCPLRRTTGPGKGRDRSQKGRPGTGPSESPVDLVGDTGGPSTLGDTEVLGGLRPTGVWKWNWDVAGTHTCRVTDVQEPWSSRTTSPVPEPVTVDLGSQR